jgi:Short C-terminal domain
LRIELSRPLVAIRDAQQARSAGDSGSAASVGTELQKLADLLDRGLLSRDEFDQLKAKLIASI